VTRLVPRGFYSPRREGRGGKGGGKEGRGGGKRMERE